MKNIKHALLDTDFISKMYSIRKDENNTLIDRILEMPNYCFYCHKNIQTELEKHVLKGASRCLENYIRIRKIICYTDEDIIHELEAIYGSMACNIFVQLLKIACEAYRAGYFMENFFKVAAMDSCELSKCLLLKSLKEDEDAICIGQNLGEIKTYILLQMLQLKYASSIYVFCSDDRNARSGIISIGNVRCISVLSSFLRLKKELDFQLDEAYPYIQSFLEYCVENKIINFKVQDTSKERRICKIPCRQVMKEIYEGKFIELLNGNLQYI